MWGTVLACLSDACNYVCLFLWVKDVWKYPWNEGIWYVSTLPHVWLFCIMCSEDIGLCIFYEREMWLYFPSDVTCLSSERNRCNMSVLREEIVNARLFHENKILICVDRMWDDMSRSMIAYIQKSRCLAVSHIMKMYLPHWRSDERSRWELSQYCGMCEYPKFS